MSPTCRKMSPTYFFCHQHLKMVTIINPYLQILENSSRNYHSRHLSNDRRVTVMLVTSWCWWLNDGDHFKMLVTKKVCWWHFSACWWHYNRSPTSLYARMWCWWPICYVGDMKFNLLPNSMKMFPSLNRSWGTYIGHQYQHTPEFDVGDWYLMLVTWLVTKIQIFSPTHLVSNIRHQHRCNP